MRNSSISTQNIKIFKNLEIRIFLFTQLTVNYIRMFFNHPVIFSVIFRPIIFVYLSLIFSYYRFFGQIYRNSDFFPSRFGLFGSVSLSLSLFVLNEKKKILDSTLWAAPSKSSEREKEEKNPRGKSGQKIKFIAPSSLFILRLHPLWNVWLACDG